MNISPPALPASARKPRSRLWLWILGVSLVVVIAALILVSLDEPPPDLSDLVVEPVSLADDENAYVLLSRVAQRASALVADQDFDGFDDHVAGRTWDGDRVAAWLSPLDSIWPELESAVTVPHSQGRTDNSVDALFPEVGQLQKLSQLSLLLAHSRLRAGQPDAAMRLSFLSLQAGRHLQQSRANLICYLSGVSIQTQALKTIQVIARHRDVSPALLRETIAMLEANRPTPDGVGYALRNEIYFFESAAAMAVREHPVAPYVMAVPALYKPNKTRRLHADFIRDMIRVPHLTMPEISAEDQAFRERFDTQTHLRVENIAGRMLLRIVVPTFASIGKTYLRHSSHFSATQALLAVRIHEIEHGGLPASLAETVPSILPAVPRDYCDGGDIKYSPAAGFIWSIGEDNLTISSSDHVAAARKRDIVVPIREQPAVKAEGDGTTDTL